MEGYIFLSFFFFCMDYECMVYDMDCMVLLFLGIYGCIFGKRERYHGLEKVRDITVLGK